MTDVARCLVLLVVSCVSGCTSHTAVLPVVDLQTPGWTTRTGLVSWLRADAGNPIAGDLLAASRGANEVVVNFSKAAIPIFAAQAASEGWRIDFLERGGSYSGGGRPPDRFVWFSLPALFADPDMGLEGWSIDWPASDEVLLEHGRSGERIRVLLDP